MDVKRLYRYCRWINSQKIPERGTVYYRDNTDAMASFVKGDTQYHLFDGTSNIWEMLKNLLGFRGKKERRGAYLSYDLTAEDFMEKIEFDVTKKQFFCGVSRGGAIAIDCLVRSRFRDAEALTFVAPPAGGKQFLDTCQKIGFKHTRIIVKGDIVPKLPSWGRHYETRLIVLKTKARGFVKKHLSVGEGLEGVDIEL